MIDMNRNESINIRKGFDNRMHMFISGVKSDFLKWESMGNCSVAPPAPCGRFRNCNIWYIMVGIRNGN